MRQIQKFVGVILAIALIITAINVAPVKAKAENYVKLPTTMQCSVWSAPNTAEANRVKVIPAGYEVTIDNSVTYLSTAGDGKIFYRTSKGCYILCKCFFANGVLPSNISQPTPTQAPVETKKTTTNGKVIEVNASNFKSEVLESDIPVFIEVGGDWCGWCVKFEPVIEDAAKKHTDIKFCHITYDSSHHDLDFVECHSKKNFTGFPGIVVFKDGKCTYQGSGYRNSSDFEDFIKSYLQ